jgi:PII-like signaling protein
VGNTLFVEISSGGIMNGYQISFFTQQDKSHKGKPMADWIVHLAQEMGLPGATMIAASEGFGHHGRLHSARFFELADQPQEVCLIVSADDSDRLFDRLNAEKVQVFYVRSPVEFGILGEAD